MSEYSDYDGVRLDVTIDTDSESFQRVLEKSRRTPEKLTDMTYRAMQRIMARMRQELDDNMPYVSGNTQIANNYSVRVDNGQVVSMFSNPLPSAYSLEYGRLVGSFPPPGPIRQWAETLLGPISNSDVFLICRAIATRGITARHIFSRAFEIAKSRVRSQWFREVLSEAEIYWND